LIPQCQEIEHAGRLHKASLRLFRNGTFHFQRDPGKFSQFFAEGHSRLEWAEELHLKLAIFFSRYRGIRDLAYLEETGLWER